MKVLTRATGTAQITGHGGHRRGGCAGLLAASGLLPPQRLLASVPQLRGIQDSESEKPSTKALNVFQQDTQFVDAIHLCYLRTVIGQERTFVNVTNVGIAISRTSTL